MKVLLIGDPMLDINYYCKVRDVVCREAPIPILDIMNMDTRPGGAGNVKENLEALGLFVDFVPTSTQSTKTRIWVEDRLICRFDADGQPLHGDSRDDHHVDIKSRDEYNAIVVSDYQKGFLQYLDFDTVVHYPNGRPVVFVDTKSPNPETQYRGVDFIFPNELEWPRVSPYIREFQYIIRKDGANGCFVDEHHIPTKPVYGAEPTGAGDTFLAAFVWAFLSGECGRDLPDHPVPTDYLCRCASVANKAAGIACTKRGTAVVTKEELKGIS